MSRDCHASHVADVHPGAAMGLKSSASSSCVAVKWQQIATKYTDIRQAYLALGGKSSVRVRISDNRTATLTVKSRPAELRRLELEYPIPTLEAEALIVLREGSLVEKVRYLLPWNDLAWEIDVFSGENFGLVLAEIELRNEHQPIELPPWIGKEVTGQRQFYNGFLAQRPFSSWSHSDSIRQCQT
jgi:adenylate cyclase